MCGRVMVCITRTLGEQLGGEAGAWGARDSVWMINIYIQANVMFEVMIMVMATLKTMIAQLKTELLKMTDH